MKHHFAMLLQYSWLFACVIAILFQIRCLSISKILKKEYSVTSLGISSMKWTQNEGAGRKEIGYLIIQLKQSRIWLRTFFVAAVLIFTFTHI